MDDGFCSPHDWSTSHLAARIHHAMSHEGPWPWTVMVSSLLPAKAVAQVKAELSVAGWQVTEEPSATPGDVRWTIKPADRSMHGLG